jgi:hypothetical protein
MESFKKFSSEKFFFVPAVELDGRKFADGTN